MQVVGLPQTLGVLVNAALTVTVGSQYLLLYTC